MEYGTCDLCHTPLKAEWFYEKEHDERMLHTGRVRKAVNCLVCPNCLKEYVCDDSFDGPWFTPMEPLDQAVVWQELDTESFNKDIGNKIYLHILEMSKTSKNINKAELLKKDWITEDYLIACMSDEKFCDLIKSKGINIL